MGLLTMKDLNETETLQFQNLKKKMMALWNYKANYSFNLSYIKRRDKVIFSLYIYPFTLVDGKRKYARPRKIYKRYEAMSSELDYFNELLQSGCELWTTYYRNDIDFSKNFNPSDIIK